MHCEKAPCELVCPVGATMHDSEGLNVQVYNRCVGTRFCSNNCPYKVRRFNFLQYSDDDDRDAEGPAQPERHRAHARRDGEVHLLPAARRARRASTPSAAGVPLADGDVVTACQAACPTRAIHFGDLRDPASEVAAARLAAPLRAAGRTEHAAAHHLPGKGAAGRPWRERRKVMSDTSEPPRRGQRITRRRLLTAGAVIPIAGRRWRCRGSSARCRGRKARPTCRARRAMTRRRLRLLRAAEAAFIEAAVARLIPADELGPGAVEAGVPVFIDRQLAGAYGRGARWYMQGPWAEGTEHAGLPDAAHAGAALPRRDQGDRRRSAARQRAARPSRKLARRRPGRAA